MFEGLQVTLKKGKGNISGSFLLVIGFGDAYPPVNVTQDSFVFVEHTWQFFVWLFCMSNIF